MSKTWPRKPIYSDLVGNPCPSDYLQKPPASIQASQLSGRGLPSKQPSNNLTNAYRHELGKNVPGSTRHRIERLLEARIINDQLASILRDMNGTRNMIAHGEDIPLHYETVRLFEETAAYVESIVEQLEESRPNPG